MFLAALTACMISSLSACGSADEPTKPAEIAVAETKTAAAETPAENPSQVIVISPTGENGSAASEVGSGQPAVEGEKIVFRFAGDVNLAEEGAKDLFMSNMQILKNDFGGDLTACFSDDLLELMRSADIFMLNNEFTYTKRGTPTPNKDWTFRADPENVNLLLDIGTDVVGLANNHAFDWGEDSLFDTMATLDEAGIDRVGAGADLEEAKKAVYYTMGGKTFAIVASTAVEKEGDPEYGMSRHATEDSPGVLSTIDPTECLDAIRTAKANSDYVFVYVHWGTESTDVWDPEQKELARLYIDEGADAVIGNHPHVLQGFEYYNGKPILYSLGNYWFNTKDRETCLLEFTIDTATMEVQTRFIPCLQSNCTTKLVTDVEQKRDMIDYMNEISIRAHIGEDGVVVASE